MFVGFGYQAISQEAVVNDTETSVVKKHKHPDNPEEPSICENLTIVECLEIIIPAIWEREVERDCE